MSRTIIATHNSDPSAGNDPAVDYKIAATDDTTSVALDMDQLANAVAVRIGTSPPPVDPPPDPVDEDLNQLVVTIQNNTLQANIQPVTGVDYTHQVVLKDDDAEPTYPTDFTQGPIPSLVSLAADPDNPVSADWEATTTVYVWVYDTATSLKKEILDPNGVSGVEVTTRDTLPPAGLAIAIDGSGNWTITEPVDAGIGLDPANTYDIYIDNELYIAGTTSPTGNLGVTSGTYVAHVDARDLANPPNIATTSENQITFTIAASTGAGIVSLPTTEQTVAEGAGSITIPITRDNLGGTATDDFSVDVYTTDWTAESGTNFTGITPGSPTTVSFAGGSTSENLVISITNVPESTNKQFFVVLDWDSADFASGAVQRGTESVSVIITGGGLTALAGYQMSSTDPYYVAIQCENYANGGSIRSSITTGQTADAWVSDAGARYADGFRMSTPAANTYGSATVLDPEAYYLEYQIAFNSTAVAANTATDLWDILMRISCHNAANSPPNSSVYVGPVHLTLINPITSISVPATTATVTLDHNVVTSMAGNKVWFEGVEGTNAAEYNSPGGTPSNGLTVATHVAGTNVFTITGMTTGNPDAGTGNLLGADIAALNLTPTTAVSDWSWLWQQDDEASNSIQVGCDTAATRYLRIYGYLTSADIDCFTVSARANNSGAGWTRTDVNITDNGSAGDALDDGMGHVESTYSASSSENPSADVENTDVLQLPLPDATINPTTVIPADLANNQSRTTDVYFEVANTSGLYLNKFNLLLPSGAILGSPGNPDFIVTQGPNWARLKPNNSLTSGLTYTVELDARVNDNGTMKSVVFAAPPHTFSIIDTTVPATLYSLDFEGTGYSLPHALTSAEARSLMSGTNFSGADADRMWLVSSPMNRGPTALRIDYEPNYIGPWCQGQIDVSDKDEMYLAFDVYFPNGYIFPKMQKMIALIGGGHVGNTNPNLLGTQVYCGFNVAGRNSSVSSPVANVDGEIRVYRYTATRAQENIGTRAAFQRGVKNTVELRVKNNTSASCTSCDGITQAWLNGSNILNLTTTKWISTVDASLQWEKLFMHFYVGGQGSDFEHAQNQSVYFDNFLVSENPITHS